MFAIVGSLLNVTGAYRRALSREVLRIDGDPPKVGLERAEEIRKLGKEWHEKIAATGGCPDLVSTWWKEIIINDHITLQMISNNFGLCRSLLNLLSVSDEASAELSIVRNEHNKINALGRYFFNESAITSSFAKDSPYGMSMCRYVHLSRVRVLPKMHTPRTGITLRSLSLYLALCPADEVRIMWHNTQMHSLISKNNGNKQNLNVLLVPWPMEINPSDIHSFSPPSSEDGGSQYQKLFRFSPNSDLEYKGIGVVETVRRLMERSIKTLGNNCIDIIIMPELSINDHEYTEIKSLVNDCNIMLIAGIRGTAADSPYPENKAAVYIPSISTTTEFFQYKHHRWLLDPSQIINYGLTSTLAPNKNWWEGIQVEPRKLHFVNVADWLYICALICEDLARQDPMASVIRAIGPSLLVALLMDGPQLTTRWPSYYATVLADDPGTSVLTFTSFGMVKLSHAMRQSSDYKTARTVALWKDRKTGIVPIDLPVNAMGLVLCLARRDSDERSADQRAHKIQDNMLVLGGVHPIEI